MVVIPVSCNDTQKECEGKKSRDSEVQYLIHWKKMKKVNRIKENPKQGCGREMENKKSSEEVAQKRGEKKKQELQESSSNSNANMQSKRHQTNI